MNRPEYNPEYWRARAEEVRAIGASLHDPTAKAHMESAAESYDRLAEMAERKPLIEPAPPKAENQ